MDGSSANQSPSLETLVIINTASANEVKQKLKIIIKVGPLYEYDVSSCLKSLLTNSDQDIVTLTVEAISELTKCDDKRKTYTLREIIEPIVNFIKKDITPERFELVKHSCRAIGNLCCDNDEARKLVLSYKGVGALKFVIENTEDNSKAELQLFACKALLNYAIGGQQFSDSIIKEDIIPLLSKIIWRELGKSDVDDNLAITVMLLFSVLDDNTSELLFEESVNLGALSLLKETRNIKVSELCLELLHSQAEHDSVKNLLAQEGGIQIICSRLEVLVATHEAGDIEADDEEVDSLMKQACDLIIIVLTGDESMHILYDKGNGEVYKTMVRWLSHSNNLLMTTAVLAIGNFARQDDYCAQMMENNIFDKLLDIFKSFHNFAIQIQKDPNEKFPVDKMTVAKVEHAVLSSLRNLLVPVVNKRVAAQKGTATKLLLNALPTVNDPHVAFKLLAAVRMLVDGHEGVASELCVVGGALEAVAGWGRAGQLAGAGGEAPRLVAWAARQLRGAGPRARILQVDGCISSLVNMLVSSHSVMQNEAILALTLLAIESITDRKTPVETPSHFDLEKSFIDQLIKAEIGKHVSVLIDANCGKMPVEVAENLLAFLDITSKKNKIAFDLKEANVQDILQKIIEARQDFSEDLKACAHSVIAAINDNGRKEQNNVPNLNNLS